MMKKYKDIKHIRKDLGQHFLINQELLKKIVSVIDIKDKYLIEIGGGIGNLTEEIFNNSPSFFRVIEKDKLYCQQLKEKFEECKNIEIINGDCMEENIEGEIIIGNLPYNISTSFIEKCLIEGKYEDMLFMVQKEVAERFTGENFSYLSVLSLSFNKVKKVFNVSPSSFYPPPKVMSTIIHFKKIKEMTKEMKEELLLLIRRAFSYPNRKLSNNLKNTRWSNYFKVGLRAKDITVEEYIKAIIKKT